MYHWMIRAFFTAMELSQIIPHIEALIFASDKPLNSRGNS